MVVAGPTAVGKTALTIELAEHYHSVILSADSRQFYKELNIGTAKPTPAQLEAVPHYFVGTRSVTELYGAGHYEKDVLQLLPGLFEQHNLVFMVGGSGLYINAVLNGVDDFEEVPAEVRNAINLEFESKGLLWLQDEVKRADENYFNTVDTGNPQRLIRALEVCRHTGKPYSYFLNRKKTERDFIPVKILLNCERSELYKRINARVDEMMANGLLEEAQQLLPFRNHNALKTVGYNEIYDYLEGKTDLPTAIDKIKQHTRNYAKRQITWFKNKETFEEFFPEEKERIIQYIDGVMKHG